MKPSTLPAAALAAAALAASCWSPVFSPELSLAQATVAKMDKASTIDVSGVRRSEIGDGFFTPRRAAAPADGIWISGYGDEDEPYEWSTPGYMRSAPVYELSLRGQTTFSPPPAARPTLSMSPSGTIEAATVARKSGLLWGLAELFALEADNAGLIGIDYSAGDFPGPGSCLGIGFIAVAPTEDRGCAVVLDQASGSHYLVEFDYAGSSLVLDGAVDLTLPAGAEPALAGFAVRSGGYHFLSFVDASGASRTVRWAAGSPGSPTELALDETLVGALFDGTLLSSDGMTMTARDSDGAALYSFPTGSLRFVHERYDAASEAWIAVFSRTMFVPYGSEGYGTLRSETYEIASSALPTLAR